MNRLRVVRVIGRMNVGGPALQVTALIEGLDAQRFDHRVLVGSVGPDEADHLLVRAPHLEVTRVPDLGRSPRALGDARALVALVAIIREVHPHIVHTHTAKAGVLGRLAARVCGVPHTVHTFHGHLLHGYFPPVITAAVRNTERWLATTTSRLVAVGERVRDELVAARIGRPAQYVVVPPGVRLPPPLSQSEARRRLGLPPDVPVVAFVGRVTAIKRPDRFLDMADRVVSARPDTRFLVAGEGDLLPTMREQALAFGERVHFLGWRSDVETVHAASDLAVLTSDNEGMPVSLIEAALVGRPAVTTDVGSAAEVVADGSTGFVTPPDADRIAASVLRLLDDEDLRRTFGRTAAIRAQRLFSAQRLVTDTERLYEELVAEPSGATLSGSAGSGPLIKLRR